MHAVRHMRETFDVTARCLASLSILYMAVTLIFRYRRATVGELAAKGIGMGSSNSIAGDGPGEFAISTPRGRSFYEGFEFPLPADEAAASNESPARPALTWVPRQADIAFGAGVGRDEVVALREAAAEVAVPVEREAGERGRRGRALANGQGIVAVRLAASGLYLLDVRGSGNASYTVRVPSAEPRCSTCSCPDHVKRAQVCKHIVAALLAAARLDPDGVLPPAEQAEDVARSPGGSRIAGDALRALRDAEDEAAALREELAVLRARLTVAEAKGDAGEAADESVPSRGVRRLTAGATLEEWGRAIASAVDTVRLACYTFDMQSLVLKLQEARKRRVQVKVMFSQQDRNQAKNQQSQLQALRACGCDVRGWSGTRMHAKWLIADGVFIVGSCNFSEASQRDLERGVRILGLPAEDLADEVETFDGYFERCSVFAEGLGFPLPSTPLR